MDITIVKFDRALFYDAAGHIAGLRYSFGKDKCETLATYSEVHIVKRMLLENSNCRESRQYIELTKLRLAVMEKLAGAMQGVNQSEVDELYTFAKDLNTILNHTDFQKHVIAWCWI